MGQEPDFPDEVPIVDGLGPNPASEELESGLRPIDRFRRGAVGSVLAAGLTGLADVLDPRDKDEVAIVETVGGDPPRTERIVLRLDPDDPADSIVMVRTWMAD